MKSRKIQFILTATSAILLSPATFAADGTWNTMVSPSSWNTPGNWLADTADGAGFTANFNTQNLAADTTVTLDADRTIGNLIFGDPDPSSAGSWILTAGDPAGKLILAATTPTITVNAMGANKNANITATLEGTSGFTKTGAGTLVLNNATNTISGPVVLSEGQLTIQTRPLINATSIAINAGTLISATAALNPMGTAAITFGGGTLQYNNDPGTDYSTQFSTAANQPYRINVISIAGPIDRVATFSSNLASVGGTLTKLGTGVLILDAANTYTGTTAISSGTLEVRGSIANSANTSITSGARLIFNSPLAQSYGNVISGAGTLIKQGAGTLTLSGVNTFSGGITINGGILSVGANNNLGANPVAATPANIVINGGTLAASAGFTLNANRGIALGSATPSSGGAIDVATGTLTYGGIITNNGGTNSLTKTGSGTLTLSVANTYTGGTILNAGILNYGNATAISSGPVRFTGASILQAGVPTTLANPISVDSGIVGTIGTSGSATTLSGAITGAGTLAKGGTALLTLTGGLGNTISGGVQVFSGRLNVTDGLSLTNTGPVTVGSGGSLNYSRNFLLGNDLTNPINLSGPGVTGFGALNLQGDVTASGPITLAANATISHNFNNATISGSITGTDRNLTLTTTQATIPPQPGLVISGPIQLGTGGITVAAVPVVPGETNTVTLSGTNSYTGETRVQTGTLILSGAARINNSATVRIDAGAILNLDFAATDKVGALFLPGDPNSKPDGTYGSLASSATFKSADFLGNGILQVGGVGGDYATWASANGIPGQPFDGDFNQDGISNGVAYALGKSPTASSQPAGVLLGSTITFTKGTDAIANSDVSWIIETSVTLSGSWLPEVTQAPGNSAATISYNLNPVPGTPKKFARLKVVKTP